VGARDVFDSIDPPIEEDVTNICSLTMASHPFDVGAVHRAHVKDRSPSLDLDRAGSPATHARHLWSINHTPRFEEHMADGFAVYSDIANSEPKATQATWFRA
jgi:hypothetical protein